jgi:hypothetical protein
MEHGFRLVKYEEDLSLELRGYDRVNVIVTQSANERAATVTKSHLN